MPNRNLSWFTNSRLPQSWVSQPSSTSKTHPEKSTRGSKPYRCWIRLSGSIPPRQCLRSNRGHMSWSKTGTCLKWSLRKARILSQTFTLCLRKLRAGLRGCPQQHLAHQLLWKTISSRFKRITCDPWSTTISSSTNWGTQRSSKSSVTSNLSNATGELTLSTGSLRPSQSSARLTKRGGRGSRRTVP